LTTRFNVKVIWDTQYRNAHIAVTRAGGDPPFEKYKRHHELGRTRLMDLTKNAIAYGIAAMVLNIHKGAKFLGLFSLDDQGYTE